MDRTGPPSLEDRVRALKARKFSPAHIRRRLHISESTLAAIIERIEVKDHGRRPGPEPGEQGLEGR